MRALLKNDACAQSSTQRASDCIGHATYDMMIEVFVAQNLQDTSTHKDNVIRIPGIFFCTLGQ